MRPATTTTTTTEKSPIKDEVVEVISKDPKVVVTETVENAPKTTDNDSITIINALNTTNGENVKSEKVEKSTQSIKTILIGSSMKINSQLKISIIVSLYACSVYCHRSFWARYWSYMPQRLIRR